MKMDLLRSTIIRTPDQGPEVSWRQWYCSFYCCGVGIPQLSLDILYLLSWHHNFPDSLSHTHRSQNHLHTPRTGNVLILAYIQQHHHNASTHSTWTSRLLWHELHPEFVQVVMGTAWVFHGLIEVLRFMKHEWDNAAGVLVRLKHMYKEYMLKMLLEGKGEKVKV